MKHSYRVCKNLSRFLFTVGEEVIEDVRGVGELRLDPRLAALVFGGDVGDLFRNLHQLGTAVVRFWILYIDPF